MRLDDLLTPAAVLHGVHAADKAVVLDVMALHAARLTGLPAAVIGAALRDREARGATGFGGGTAIPHARVPGVIGVQAVLAQLAAPVDWGALDGAPVDIVVVLLAPAEPEAGHRADHLKALARVSRMLRDVMIVDRLRHATTPAALIIAAHAQDALAARSQAA